VQRITNFVEDARRWFSGVLQAGQRIEIGAERGEAVNPTELGQPDENIAEAIKPPTVKEAIKQTPAVRPPEDFKRSRGLTI
jgi:hypothetical protein